VAELGRQEKISASARALQFEPLPIFQPKRALAANQPGLRRLWRTKCSFQGHLSAWVSKSRGRALLMLLFYAALAWPISSHGNGYSSLNMMFGVFQGTEYATFISASGGVSALDQNASAAQVTHGVTLTVQQVIDNGSRFLSYGYGIPGEGPSEVRLQAEVVPGTVSGTSIGNYAFARVESYKPGYFQYPYCYLGSRPDTALFNLYFSGGTPAYGPPVGFSGEDGYRMRAEYSLAFSYAKYTPAVPASPPQEPITDWITVPIASGMASWDGSGPMVQELSFNTSVLDSVSPIGLDPFAFWANLSIGPLEEGAWYSFKFSGTFQTEVSYVPDAGSTGLLLLIGFAGLAFARMSSRRVRVSATKRTIVT
jgi:hypothetical protein